MIKTLIVDDERLARVELRRLLEVFRDIEIAGEASHAEEALTQIKSLEPDLVFLDVQMPGSTGFDLLEKLDASPEIIFVTAYDEHALRAFEYNALDYLLKPIDPARLEVSVRRARDILSKSQSPEAPPMQINGNTLGPDDRVFVRDGEKCWFLPVRDITMLESDGNYSIVRFDRNAPVLPRSLVSLEERLDPSMFFRANRSQIINLQKVKNVDLWFSGSLKVTMEGGTVVELSRRQAAAFREKLSL